MPVGGPGALVAAMVERFEQLGGRLRTSLTCPAVHDEQHHRRVTTDAGSFAARCVVSSQGRWSDYPGDAPAGLAAGMLLLAVRRELPLPEGVHTLVDLPRDVAGWMGELDQGRTPPEFGVHVFRGPRDEARAHYTLNLCLLFPRGQLALDAPRAARLEQHLLARAEALLPGLPKALLHHELVSPAALSKQHGLSSRLTPRVAPAGFRKPDAYDARTRIHHVGGSVGPPGGHAGQAVLSGAQVALRVARWLERAA